MDLLVDVLVLEVLAHVLGHQVAAVRGRVDQHVVGRCRDRAVEHHLERLVARLVGLEGQIVAIEDEALRRGRRPGRRYRPDRPGRASPPRSAASRASAYLLSSAFTSDDLPVPRAPVSSTLFAGRPCTNWRVFCSTSALLRVDSAQVVQPDAVQVRHRLQEALARALAPAPRDGDASSRAPAEAPAAAAPGAP